MLNPPDIPSDRDDFHDSFAADIRLIAAAARRFRLRHEQNDVPDDAYTFDPPASNASTFPSTHEPVTVPSQRGNPHEELP